MSFMKNIFRYAAAGLLVCGLCTATPPAQALANKDTKQAPVDATKYLTKKFRTFIDAYNALDDCVMNRLPLDAEWAAKDRPWEPDKIDVCKPKFVAAEKALEDATNLSLAPPLLWSSKATEDRIKNILTTVKAVAADLFFVPRFFCYMKDDHSNVLEAIQYMRQTGAWLKSVAPEYKKRMKEMSDNLQKFKDRGDVNGLKELGKYIKYANGKMTPVNRGIMLYDIDRHVKAYKEKNKAHIDALSAANTIISSNKTALYGPVLNKIESMKDSPYYYEVFKRSYDGFVNDSFMRAEFAITELLEYWMEQILPNEARFLVMKDLNTFAPLLEPVSSYSYIEAWQNACQYYIPNSMDTQIKRVTLD